MSMRTWLSAFLTGGVVAWNASGYETARAPSAAPAHAVEEDVAPVPYYEPYIRAEDDWFDSYFVALRPEGYYTAGSTVGSIIASINSGILALTIAGANAFQEQSLLGREALDAEYADALQ